MPQSRQIPLTLIAPERTVPNQGIGQRGFTLMELLIAMSLIGLMMVLLFGGLRLGARSWDAAELRASESSDQRLIWTFLQRSLKEMKPVYLPLEGGEKHLAFSGSENALEFVGAMPERIGPGGAYILRIEAPEAGGNRNLVLRRWLFHPEVLEGMEAVPPWKPLYERVGEAKPLSDDEEWNGALYGEHLLVEDIEKLEIDYYGTVEGGVDPEWQDEWEDANEAPLLVRLRVYRDEGDWPPLLAPLPAPADATGAQPSGLRARTPLPIRSRR